MPRNRRVRAVIVGSVLILLVGLFSLDYTVEKGDSLYEIARDNGVSLTDLIKANDLANPNLIYPGQVIIIPGQGGSPDVVHVVTRGETLNRIASTYGVSGKLLAEANGLKNPDLIRIGQELTVPGSSSSTKQGSNSGDTGSSSGSSAIGPNDYHIVKKGDTIDSIAAQYKGVSGATIRDANGIVGSTIYTGTRLFLNRPGYIASGNAGNGSYTVKSGDRLGDIAFAHSTGISTLVSMNNLSNANVIRVGQVLKVPTGSAWACPVGKASFINDWGFPRSGSRYHEGNDLFTVKGTPVVAPAAGTVEFVVGTVGGNQFNLTGVDGVRYLGSHMDAFAGKSRKVAAGEVIGYVGTTGNAAGTSPHLHFAMYVKDKAVNPFPSLLKFDCKR
ncbi:MAG TPA: LysM peptidoglycan-binding domain-containing protein [Acidimicrobiia bacterium]